MTSAFGSLCPLAGTQAHLEVSDDDARTEAAHDNRGNNAGEQRRNATL